ncbi:hypothetical protein L916_20473, partial [Phytophthora nicotianae]
MPPPALRVNTAHHKRLGGQYAAFSNAFGEPAAFERPLPSSLPTDVRRRLDLKVLPIGTDELLLLLRCCVPKMKRVPVVTAPSKRECLNNNVGGA